MGGTMADDVLSGKQQSCVVLGDCVEVLKQLPENSVHAVVTDPPYG
jgi:DNA modification methylase